MNEYLELGSAPADEPCVQVSPDGDYAAEMRAECRRYIARIREVLGPEPEGARLAVKGFTRDCWGYYEVVCHYSSKEGVAYAFKCESDAPVNWAD